MLHLIAKTVPDINRINHMMGETMISNLPMSERATMVHTFWCIGMPYGDVVLRSVLESGAGYVTIENDEWLFISANTMQWHTIARFLLSHPSLNIKKFGTLLVQSYPEIFKNLSTTTSPSGVLALRNL